MSTPFRAIASVAADIPKAVVGAGESVAHFFGGLFTSSGASAAPAGPVPDAPNEIVSMRGRDASFYRNNDGTTRAEFSRNRHYQDDAGYWQNTDLSFRSDGNGFVADKNDVIVRVTGPAILAIERGTGKGIRWLLPKTPSVSGRKASFQGQGGLNWNYYTVSSGLKLIAPVSHRLGPQTYSFTYQLLGNAQPFTVDSDGNLISDRFSVPRPVIIGADDNEYVGGAWQLGVNNTVSFSVDDSFLPDAALPYELDPTTIWGIGASADDDTLRATSSSYPPTVVDSQYTATDRVNISRSWVSPTYIIHNGFTRWYTSSLPDTATINSATFQAYFTYSNNANARKINAEYYSAWPIDSADYTTGAGTTASGSSGWTAPTGGGLYDFSLASLTSISKTSWTGLRLNVSGGSTPTGENRFHFASYDDTQYPAPKLIVLYNNVAPTATPSSPISSAWTNSPTLKWSYSDSNGDAEQQYQVQVSTSSSFSSVLQDSGVLSGSATQWNTTASFTTGTTYYWRVKASDGYVWGAWSSAAAFRWDVALPTGSLTAPVNESTVSGTMTLTALPSDANSGVKQVSFYWTQLGSKKLIATVTSGWSTTLDTTTLQEGRAVLTSEVTDNAGNLKTAAGGAAVVVNNATSTREDWQASASSDGLSIAGHEATVALGTGQLFTTVHEESVPGRGFDATFARGYNSASKARGILGPGWRSSPEEIVLPS